jgi:hypothetical protein
MLEMFNVIYFLWILTAILLYILIYFLFRDRSDKFKYWFLFSWTIIAWILHFSRWWLDPNVRLYEMFMKDLCGFSTLVYPFFMLSKNRIFKEYMYFVGGFFALHSLAFPNNIFGDPILYFNTIRFFFAHFILVGVPLLLVLWKMHKPSMKSIPYMVVFMLIGAMYSFTLSSFFFEVGLTRTHVNFMGLWGNTDGVYRIAEKIAPFMRYDARVNGVTISKPIPFFYMIPALIIVYTPIWVLMSLPFLKRNRKPNENQ